MIDKNKLMDAVTCKDDDNILEVSRILRDTQTRHLIVVDENRMPAGIISSVDINNRVVAEEKNTKETKAEEIMTKPIEFVDVNSSYDDAYKKMLEVGTYSLPVTENGKLIGLVDFNLLFKKCKDVAESKK